MASLYDFADSEMRLSQGLQLPSGIVVPSEVMLHPESRRRPSASEAVHDLDSALEQDPCLDHVDAVATRAVSQDPDATEVQPTAKLPPAAKEQPTGKVQLPTFSSVLCFHTENMTLWRISRTIYHMGATLWWGTTAA